VALLYAGIGTVGTMLFVLFAKLPDTTARFYARSWYRLIENRRREAILCQRTRDLQEILHRKQHLFL
jgi:hypothetical protein